MLEKTKTALKEELSKNLICTDPAPMPGDGIVNIVKALKEDLKKQ